MKDIHKKYKNYTNKSITFKVKNNFNFDCLTYFNLT